jgi:hypothetical protein
MNLHRISFALARAGDRTFFTHFIEANGDVAALYKLETLTEARIGVIRDRDFPTADQMTQVIVMSRQAVYLNPLVALEYGEGTAPFQPWLSENTPGWDAVCS